MSSVKMDSSIDSSIVESAMRAIATEIRGLEKLQEALSNELSSSFLLAIEQIRECQGRVIITGMGKSGHIGRKIAATLASTGTPAYFVHPGEASHGDLGMIRNEDVILAMSWSGETGELSDIIAYSRRYRVQLIGMTSNIESTLAIKSDILLLLPKIEEACPNGLAPTTSTTMQLALGDALAIALLEARGFTREEFRSFHPGGKLGAKLTSVRDLMHKGEAVPKTITGTKMGEAILEMTSRGFGCVAIIDKDEKIIGVISDGDLRRHMSPDLTTAYVDDIMNKTPKTVLENMLAGEAVELLNRKKITSLFVVDKENKIKGIIHIHDLLRHGTA